MKKDELIEHIRKSLEDILSMEKNICPNFGMDFVELKLDHSKTCDLVRNFLEKLPINSSSVKIEVDEEKSATREALEQKEIHLKLTGSIYDDSFCNLLADVYGYDREKFKEAVRKPVDYIVTNIEIKDGRIEFK